ncbi:MAG: VPLPA-CTERM sorting domain-containing protein [Pseudomonadota bacterium]
MKVAAVCVAGMGASAAGASTLVLDFDGTTGISGSSTIIDEGVTWGLSSSGGDGPALFDTTCTGYGGSDGCNGDADLVPSVQGENGVAGFVLIQQNSSASVPNDDPFTEWLEITIVDDIQVVWDSVSFVDEGTYVASTNLDGTLGSVTIASDNQTDQLFFGSSVLGQGDSVRITFFNGSSIGASGAIDNLSFTAVSEVPLPAPALLLMGAIGALTGVRRFRRRAA